MKTLLLLIFAFQFSFGQAWIDKLFENNSLPPDKLKHALVSEGIVAFTGYTMYHFTDRMGVGVFSGIGSAIVITGAKEIVYDRWMGKGTPSGLDFLAGTFGAVKGGLQLTVEIDMERKHGKHVHYLNFDNLAPTDSTKQIKKTQL